MSRLLLVGLGSNLGNRETLLHQAIHIIQSADIKLLALSPVYESEPWGVNHDTSYLNAVAAFCSSLEARQVLQHLQNSERQMGRTSKSDLKPRMIDLDVLDYGNQVYTEPDFVIPHPKMELRKFVLQPLMEVCPFWLHPVLHKSAKELLEKCPDSGWIKPWK